MSSLWKDVNRKQVCPICGKPDWCRMSADGQWAICRRLDTGDGHRKVDKSGAEYWVYHFHGHITPTSIPPMPPSVVTLGRATDDHLHQVYGVLLRSLPLTSQHHTQLSQRGLTERDISFRHYGSLPQQGRSRLAKALVERFGEPLCTRVPGLYIREEGQRRWWSLAGAAGLVIPVRNVAGHKPRQNIVYVSAERSRPWWTNVTPRIDTCWLSRFEGPLLCTMWLWGLVKLMFSKQGRVHSAPE
jgi:hypothetical protein